MRVMQVRVCGECGKEFSLIYGLLTDYLYKMHNKETGHIEYFCCYSCYNKSKSKLQNKSKEEKVKVID